MTHKKERERIHPTCKLVQFKPFGCTLWPLLISPKEAILNKSLSEILVKHRFITTVRFVIRWSVEKDIMHGMDMITYCIIFPVKLLLLYEIFRV